MLIEDSGAVQKVEIDPTEVKESSADTMLDCWRYFKELESAK